MAIERYEGGYDTVEVERDGRVGIVRWNRPETMNAFNTTMYAEWIEAYDAFNADDGIGAVVITGAGRAYSSGADIGGFESTFTGAAVAAAKRPPHEPFDPWYLADGKPTVAAVNGVAVGVGFTSLLWCDLVIASTAARFSARFAALGLAPELASTWMLPRLIGVQHAKEMMLTGRIYGAEEVRDLGLVRRVVEPEALLPEAIALAAEIAANPAPTLRTIKQMITEDLFATDLQTIGRRSSSEFARTRGTPEHREALLAFRDRRAARFHDGPYMDDLGARLARGERF